MKLLITFLMWLVLLPIHLFMGALCWLLSPILPLFAIGRDTLPNWLSWFQTPDAPLDGDSGFVNVFPPEKWPKYLRRVLWLIRNPAYGFAWTVLAFQPDSPEFKWYGTISQEQELNGKQGFGWWLMVLPDGHFQFSLRKPSVFSKQLRFRFGWRLIGIARGNWLEKQKFVFTFNPFKEE